VLSKQIGDRVAQVNQAIIKLAKSQVATSAEKTTHFASNVIVIDVKSVFTISTRSFAPVALVRYLALANRTSATL